MEFHTVVEVGSETSSLLDGFREIFQCSCHVVAGVAFGQRRCREIFGRDFDLLQIVGLSSAHRDFQGSHRQPDRAELVIGWGAQEDLSLLSEDSQGVPHGRRCGVRRVDGPDHASLQLGDGHHRVGGFPLEGPPFAEHPRRREGHLTPGYVRHVSQDESHRVHHMAEGHEQRPAGFLVSHQPCPVGVHFELREHLGDDEGQWPADSPVGQEFARPADRRSEAALQTHSGGDPSLCRGGRHLPALGGVQSKRPFAEHRFSGSKGGHRQRMVKTGLDRNRHQVYVGIVAQLLYTGVPLSGAPLRGGRLGGLRPGGAYGLQRQPGRRPDGGQMGTVTEAGRACAHHSHSYGLVVTHRASLSAIACRPDTCTRL